MSCTVHWRWAEPSGRCLDQAFHSSTQSGRNPCCTLPPSFSAVGNSDCPHRRAAPPGRPWLQVVAELYQQPGVWYGGPQGSSVGFSVHGRSEAARRHAAPAGADPVVRSSWAAFNWKPPGLYYTKTPPCPLLCRQTFWLRSLSWYAATAFHRRCSKLQVGGRANTVSANPPRRGWPSSKPPCAIGAKTPNQNPRGQPLSSTQAFSGDAETTARTNIAEPTAQKNQAMSGPQLPLHKKQTDSEWGAVTSHTAPESSAQRAKRSGPAKSVCFSPDFEYILSGVFEHLPALNRSPDPVSGSSESSRSRQKPSQSGV